LPKLNSFFTRRVRTAGGAEPSTIESKDLRYFAKRQVRSFICSNAGPSGSALRGCDDVGGQSCDCHQRDKRDRTGDRRPCEGIVIEYVSDAAATEALAREIASSRNRAIGWKRTSAGLRICIAWSTQRGRFRTSRSALSSASRRAGRQKNALLRLIVRLNDADNPRHGSSRPMKGADRSRESVRFGSKGCLVRIVTNQL
jgi:hypothetical protein